MLFFIKIFRSFPGKMIFPNYVRKLSMMINLNILFVSSRYLLLFSQKSKFKKVGSLGPFSTRQPNTSTKFIHHCFLTIPPQALYYLSTVYMGHDKSGTSFWQKADRWWPSATVYFLFLTSLLLLSLSGMTWLTIIDGIRRELNVNTFDDLTIFSFFILHVLHVQLVLYGLWRDF